MTSTYVKDLAQTAPVMKGMVEMFSAGSMIASAVVRQSSTVGSLAVSHRFVIVRCATGTLTLQLFLVLRRPRFGKSFFKRTISRSNCMR